VGTSEVRGLLDDQEEGKRTGGKCTISRGGKGPHVKDQPRASCERLPANGGNIYREKKVAILGEGRAEGGGRKKAKSRGKGKISVLSGQKKGGRGVLKDGISPWTEVRDSRRGSNKRTTHGVRGEPISERQIGKLRDVGNPPGNAGDPLPGAGKKRLFEQGQKDEIPHRHLRGNLTPYFASSG